MAPPPSDTRPIKSHDDLLEPFFTACKPESEFRIGAEQEKIAAAPTFGNVQVKPAGALADWNSSELLL